jgi:uncharacterized protein YeaO (DUF488 family)
MSTQRSIGVKRAYDPRLPSDGRRILVDRIWPRGLRRSAAELDEWCKDIAPSTALRRWYGHAAARFGELRDRYLLELDDPAHAEALAHLQALTRDHRLTLLTATKDLDTSHATVLAEWLRASAGHRSADEADLPHQPARRKD